MEDEDISNMLNILSCQFVAIPWVGHKSWHHDSPVISFQADLDFVGQVFLLHGFDKFTSVEYQGLILFTLATWCYFGGRYSTKDLSMLWPWLSWFGAGYYRSWLSLHNVHSMRYKSSIRWRMRISVTCWKYYHASSLRVRCNTLSRSQIMASPVISFQADLDFIGQIFLLHRFDNFTSVEYQGLILFTLATWCYFGGRYSTKDLSMLWPWLIWLAGYYRSWLSLYNVHSTTYKNDLFTTGPRIAVFFSLFHRISGSAWLRIDKLVSACALRGNHLSNHTWELLKCFTQSTEVS